ncbi:MAG: hypothetical protein RQ751_08670 [Longimicrobiales bacterium]|nr:hypothetical protein [Longimicrobiales bacterium]
MARTSPAPRANARPASRRRFLLLAGLALLAGAGACTDPAGPPEGANAEALVGDWDASAVVVTNLAVPEQSIDLTAGGATFTLNVQPSGQYTATLTFLGSPVTEIGFLTLEGDVLTFLRQFPSPDTATAVFTQLGPDRVRFVGESAFDFDGNGESDPASLLTELERTSAPGT